MIFGPGGSSTPQKKGKSNPTNWCPNSDVFSGCANQKKQGHIFGTFYRKKLDQQKGRCWIVYFDLQGPFLTKMPSLRVNWTFILQEAEEALPETTPWNVFLLEETAKKIEKIHVFFGTKRQNPRAGRLCRKKNTLLVDFCWGGARETCFSVELGSPERFEPLNWKSWNGFQPKKPSKKRERV